MSDAWIFLAIGHGGGCTRWVRLSEVIGMADGLNHSIPTTSELATSISNLTAAGLVERQGTDTRLTPAGCEAFEAASKDGREADLQAELEAMSSKVDMKKMETAFTKVARNYSQRNGITYSAWREIGVSPAVLKSAGLGRGD